MGSRSTTTWPGDSKRVGRQFEQWRSQRRPGSRIPERLWRAAVGLARKHGVSRTSLTLHLDYYALKERVDAASTPRRDEGAFVEIPMPAMPHGPACVVEIENGQGRLRVEFQGVAAEELPELIRSVWGTDR